MKCRHKYTPMPDEADPDKQKDAWGGQAFSGSGSAGGDFGPASARVDGGSYPCPPALVPEKKLEMSTAKPEEIRGIMEKTRTITLLDIWKELMSKLTCLGMETTVQTAKGLPMVSRPCGACFTDLKSNGSAPNRDASNVVEGIRTRPSI